METLVSSCPQVAQVGANKERLWKDYFRDPSQWWDNRESKTNPRAPDFKHKLTKEALWMDGRYNPSWVKDMIATEGSCAIKGLHIAHEEVKRNIVWEMPTLEEVLSSLEEGIPPLPSPEDLAYILHTCRKSKNRAYAIRLHAFMRRSGLDAHPSFGNYLVIILVEVGCLPHAQQVFNSLGYHKECSWNSLITGYIKCGEPHHAFMLYQKMQEEDLVHPSAYTFVALLKACAKLKDMQRGSEIHAHIARIGLLEIDLFVGSTLVDMYAKCGSLSKAQNVFDKLPDRDVVSWTALIAGYAEHGPGEEALNCFKQMQLEGVSPNAFTFVCSLKACGSIGATDKGKEIHAEVTRQGLEQDLLVGSSLVDMYGKCGLLDKAQEVFDKLPVKDIISWTALIAGYAKHGHGEQALRCFEQMQLEGLSPSSVTFVCILKACGSIGAIDKGQEIHAEIARKGLEKDLLVGNTLMDMYARCGLLAKAQEMFDKLPGRDVVSWNTLITGYVEQGCSEEALNYYEQMQQEDISPNSITFVFCLKACGNTGAANKGREIHAEIDRIGLLKRDLAVGNALVDMYAKCGLLAKAQEVFDKFPVRNVASWTALIAGYAEHGCGKKALKCYELMQHEGVSPSAATFVCSLKACGSIGSIHKGQEIHAEVARKGLAQSNLLIACALVDMYAKCGLPGKAQEVFDNLPVRDVALWTALIAGYAEQGHGEEALKCFEQMQVEGAAPNVVTYVCTLKACGSIGATDKGREIHAEIARMGLLEKDLTIGNTLVDMYAKCGSLAKAQEVFDKLPVRDVVSWSALIAGYAEHGNDEEALNCYEQMQREGVSPNAVTFVFGLKACGSLGAIGKGQDLHAEIARLGLERDLLVGSNLVDMYAKHGWLAKAKEMFDKLPVRDVFSWNALMAGYAQVGESENVFICFDKMIGDGEKPNLVTFLSVLNACNHAGLVDKGQAYFEAMSKDYGLIPTLEHHTCMVDLLGRAGQLDKALTIINEMPFHPNLVVWHIVLSACQKWGNVELGREAFDHAVQLDEKDAGSYICMSNIYANANMLEEAKKVEAMIMNKTNMEEART